MRAWLGAGKGYSIVPPNRKGYGIPAEDGKGYDVASAEDRMRYDVIAYAVVPADGRKGNDIVVADGGKGHDAYLPGMAVAEMT